MANPLGINQYTKRGSGRIGIPSKKQSLKVALNMGYKRGFAGGRLPRSAGATMTSGFNIGRSDAGIRANHLRAKRRAR